MSDAFHNTFWTRQPGKAVYTAFYTAYTLLRAPLWALYYLPKFTRPHRKWSWRQAFMTRILKAVLHYWAKVESKTSLSLQPGKEKDRFIVARPGPQDLYTGVTRRDDKVQPHLVGSTWYPKRYSPDEKYVVLHFHGGAYVIGDGRTADTGWAANTLVQFSNGLVGHVFAPQYRLANEISPPGQFPAALQDAITTYYYLIRVLDIPAEKIIVSGDSAGGNLTLALLRYIAEKGEQVGLPAPACAWLWSPWCDVLSAIEKPRAFGSHPNYPTDYLNDAFGAWGARCYYPPSLHGSDAVPYVSPTRHPFSSKTPMWFTVGGAEVLQDQVLDCVREYRVLKGNRVGFWEEEAAPHDICLTGDRVGWEMEQAKAVERAAAFARQVIEGTIY